MFHYWNKNISPWCGITFRHLSKTPTWRHRYRMSKYIYSLEIDKGICDRRNISSFHVFVFVCFFIRRPLHFWWVFPFLSYLLREIRVISLLNYIFLIFGVMAMVREYWIRKALQLQYEVHATFMSVPMVENELSSVARLCSNRSLRLSTGVSVNAKQQLQPRWSWGNVLASICKVHAFKPDWGRSIFSGRKTPEHKSSGRDFDRPLSKI